MTLLALLTSLVSIFMALGACLLLALSAGVCYQLYGNKKSRWFINRVSVTASDNWNIRIADKEERNVRLTGYYRHPRLLILNFAIPGAPMGWRRSVVLLPDSADPDLIRRLRVRLGGISGENDADDFAR